jgi:membrane protein implicated in regulation of membrane protease activity
MSNERAPAAQVKMKTKHMFLSVLVLLMLEIANLAVRSLFIATIPIWLPVLIRFAGLAFAVLVITVGVYAVFLKLRNKRTEER